MESWSKTFWLLLVLICWAAPAQSENWPCWRGPRLDGTSVEARIPVHWSANSNILWKAVLPGSGHASPVVWADRLFTVAALNTQERVLLCLDRGTGRTRWQRAVVRSPLEPKHALNSHASSTPATDGAQIYVAFLDQTQMVVAAYDFEGAQKWLVRPGPFASRHGFCSSPILFEDKVIVNGDHDGDGYIVALSRKTGKELWRIDRPNKTRSYTVPLIREMAGRMQMVLTGTKCTTSYNPNDGKLIWIIDGHY